MPIARSTPRVTVNALNTLVKQSYTEPVYRRHPQRCQYTTPSSPNIHHEATDIAVLGGGITGLASAYYLSKKLPNARITLFEISSRLGGWLQSSQINVGPGKIVFEHGPRNLRPTNPNGLITLDLVRELGLEDRILMTFKESFAAQNRFIYYPDHLVRMPGPGGSLLSNFNNLLSEPVFKGIVWGAVRDLYRLVPPAVDLDDESIGSFISRHFGSRVADNIASAVIHGIYAGDIYKLSARTILPGPWETARKQGSILWGYLQQGKKVTTANADVTADVQGYYAGRRPVATDDVELVKGFNSRPAVSDTIKAARRCSVFTFKGGLGELTNRLEAKLLENPNVTIKTSSVVNRLELQSHETSLKIQLKAQDMRSGKTRDLEFTHAISTIAGRTLGSLVRLGDRYLFSNSSMPLHKARSVTVMVVNLFFSNPQTLSVRGFGYLIPRTVPFEQNPERALGVVFDSDSSIGQDEVVGTKITVMLGGHWWDGWHSYPGQHEGARMARAVLKRHLGIVEEPRVVQVRLAYNCIPQYPVGHQKNMEDASRRLERFKGRLRVAGNSYTGVGLNDCVRAARDVVQGLVDGTEKTGLESFVGGVKYSWVTAKELNEVCESK